MTRRFCVIDAEGDVGELGLLGVAFYSDLIREYVTDHERIVDLLTTHAKAGYTFVAHNASYDLPVIFWQLRIPMTAVYYNTTFNRGEWKYHPKKSCAQLWDSLDLSGGLSIAKLGDALGLPKLSTPQRLRGIDPDRYAWLCDAHGVGECVSCYALRDAEIVYRYLESYVSVLAGWGVTPQRRIAGAAVKTWRALDRPERIKLDDGRAQHLGRKAYYGGRIECFKLGHFSPLYTADIASMYPSVMAETAFPDPAHMISVYSIPVSDLPLHLEGVTDCEVDVPPSYAPPLPASFQGQRIFAVGRQRGYWTFCELRHAVALGCTIRRIYRACYSTAVLHPFMTFVGTLWELRNQYARTGDPRTQTVKVLLNSCYGRIGLRGDIRCERVEPWRAGAKMTDYPGGEPIVIDGDAFVRYPVPQSYDMEWANVLWAAQITAAARVKLHKHLIAQGGSVVYCDTDSVFSTSPIAGLGDGLGELTDHRHYDHGWIVGPKLYRLQDGHGTVTAKAKGVPRQYAEAFLRGEEVVFSSPVKPRSQGRYGLLAGTWVQIHRERQLVPYRRTPVNPGVLGTDYGWSDTLAPTIGPAG